LELDPAEITVFDRLEGRGGGLKDDERRKICGGACVGNPSWRYLTWVALPKLGSGRSI
jgi:hypothetical protein